VIIAFLLYKIGTILYNKYKERKDKEQEEKNQLLPLPIVPETANKDEKKETINDLIAKKAEELVKKEGDTCTQKPEVFNISNNIYTYTDAKAVCKAMGSRLATMDELKKAYKKGADWCNYGWTDGQLAVYPTQKSTWDKLQKGPEEHRNDCGQPGINGGFFDNPHLRFGVNCYGIKRIPKENEKHLSDFNPDYITEEERILQEKIEKYRRQIDDISLLPFNRTSWVQGGSDDKYCKIENEDKSLVFDSYPSSTSSSTPEETTTVQQPTNPIITDSPVYEINSEKFN